MGKKSLNVPEQSYCSCFYLIVPLVYDKVNIEA
jgi:hypothetical protein